MVRIAVCDIWLVTCCDFRSNLLTNIIVTTHLGVLNVNVRIKLVELCDIEVKNFS